MFRLNGVAAVTTPRSASSATRSISRGATPNTVAVTRTRRARPIAGARSSRKPAERDEDRATSPQLSRARRTPLILMSGSWRRTSHSDSTNRTTAAM